MGNSFGSQIGSAAMGMGVGAGEYQVAKQSPNLFVGFEIAKLVFGLLIVSLFFAMVVYMIRHAQPMSPSSTPDSP